MYILTPKIFNLDKSACDLGLLFLRHTPLFPNLSFFIYFCDTLTPTNVYQPWVNCIFWVEMKLHCESPVETWFRGVVSHSNCVYIFQ